MALAARRGTRWPSRARSGLFCLLAVALLGAGCADDSGPPPTSQPSRTATPSTEVGGGTATSASSPTQAPTRPDGDPDAFDFFSATTFPEGSVTGIALDDDVAVTMTAQQLTGRTLPGLGAAWTIPSGVDQFTDVQLGDDPAGSTAGGSGSASGGDSTGLVVGVRQQAGTGTDAGVDTFTVSEFDPKTGDVVRQAQVSKVQDTRGDLGPVTARIAGRRGDVVVLDVSPAYTSTTDVLADSVARHTVVAVDLATGTLVWSARPARVVGVLASRVLLLTGTSRTGGEIQARTVVTGDIAWTSLPGTKGARLVGYDDQQVVLTSASTTTGESKVNTLALSDGTRLSAHPVYSWIWTCSPTSAPIAVCTILGRDIVLGWGLDDDRPRWKLPDHQRVAPHVSSVTDDRVYGLAGDRGVVIDALTGDEIASDTGAAPSLISVWGGLTIFNDQAVFQPVAED